MARVSLLLVLVVGGCASRRPVLCDEGLVDQTVVVAAWRHREPGADGLTFGFDLDRHVGDGTGSECTNALDFTSAHTGSEGVDNQYAANLLPFLMLVDTWDGPELATLEGFERGELLRGLDVTVGDDRIPVVDLVELAPVDPVALGPRRDGLAPDQRFRVVRRERIASRCVGRSMELAAPAFDLPMGAPIGTVPMHDVHVLIDLLPDGRLDEGELGARYPASLLPGIARALGDDGRFSEETARTVAQPDMAPTSDPVVCDDISLGVGFELVPATFVP